MAEKAAGGRVACLDNLRTSLVVLVVLHHLALVYGASAPFYYQEPPFDESPWVFIGFLDFVLLNQAWFMGALFLLAGYFTPLSVDRRGTAGFLATRLVRLGIPVLIYIFVLEPIARIGFFLMPPELTGIAAPPSLAAYPGLIGLGPIWFVAMLLAFDVGYALWRMTGARIGSGETASLPGPVAVVVFVAALAAASYLLRIAVPLGKDVTLFVDVLNFPTIAYLPQYLAFFAIGVVAARRGWFAALPTAAGVAGFAAAAVATVLLFPLATGGRLFALAIAEGAAFTGGGTWQSAVYAVWDSTVAVGFGLGALVLFRAAFDLGGSFARRLAANSYAVYILHVPILVYVAWAMRGIDLPALSKFALATAIMVPVVFVAADLVRRIPGATRVL